MLAQQRTGVGGDSVGLVARGGLEVIGRGGAETPVRHEPVERVDDGHDQRGVTTDREDPSERERVASLVGAVVADDQRRLRLVPGHRRRA